VTVTDAFIETDIPTDYVADTVPPTNDVKKPCRSCGREIDTPYSGRGRHPTQCLDCKSSRAPRVKAPGTKGSNATLAEQATEALWQINGMVAFLSMIAGMPMTASAIQEREQSFREMCYNALLTDPGMCRFILKAGTNSAKVSLTMCYGMFFAAIAPTAVMELKERKAKADAAKAAEEPTVQWAA
jgi:hypothetical protein